MIARTRWLKYSQYQPAMRCKKQEGKEQTKALLRLFPDAQNRRACHTDLHKQKKNKSLARIIQASKKNAILAHKVEANTPVSG